MADGAVRMAIAVRITGWVDDHAPGFVGCEFTDCRGQVHRFIEKEPVIGHEGVLERSSFYPVPGFIACDVVGPMEAVNGRETVEVTTAGPNGWHMDTVDGLTRCLVFRDQLIPH